MKGKVADGMVYVFDPQVDDWIIKNPTAEEPMPGTKLGLLTVREFRGRSISDTLWSDIRALQSIEQLLFQFQTAGVRYAFRRVWEGGHEGQSAHYAGLAFDVGYGLDTKTQMRMARHALSRGGFDRVEPPFITPGWLHVEKDIAPASGLRGGYPRLKQGMRGVHVFVLQDALLLKGQSEGGLTGCFSAATAADLRRFQSMRRLQVTGEADSDTWRALMQLPGR